jgi:hypothetical protein
MSQSIQGAYVAPNPPNVGTDPAPQVYASLGSAAIPVQVQTQGAANLATTQLTVSNAAQQIFAARATRRSAVITNTDTAITIYVGPAAVTTGTGQAILPQTSLGIPVTAAIYLICASGSPVATGAEAYD